MSSRSVHEVKYQETDSYSGIKGKKKENISIYKFVCHLLTTFLQVYLICTSYHKL